MSLATVLAGLAGVLALLVGLWLLRAGVAMRLRRGLGAGTTVSLDNVTLISHRLGLVGRPDRLVKSGRMIVCEEWKSGREPRPWHVVQVGAYFVLIEERFRIRPTHGFIVTGDGARHRVENTDQLRVRVLDTASQIRAARRQAHRSIPVEPEPSLCCPCNMRTHCPQRRP